MDALDVRIIEALQQRGDLTHAELADAVGSTPSTCLRRKRDLRASGMLGASVFLTDPARLGRGLKAIVTATMKDHRRVGREALANRIRAEPAIAYAYGVTGDLDVILLGNFRDMVEYQEVCDRLFDSVDGVAKYTTHFVSETYKENPIVPCDVVREQSTSR